MNEWVFDVLGVKYHSVASSETTRFYEWNEGNETTKSYSNETTNGQ